MSDELSEQKKSNFEDSGSNETFEIDIFDHAKRIWDGRKIIIIITAIFSAFGLFHYLYGPTDYVSTSVLIHEYDGGGNISGGDGGLLQSLAGINIQRGGGGNIMAAARGRAPLPINLYPSIVNSTGFQKELIHKEIEFSSIDSTSTLLDYFSNHYQPPFRDRVYSFIGDVTVYLPFTIFSEIRGLLRDVKGLFSNSDDNNSSSSRNTVDISDIEVADFDDRLMEITDRERSVIERLRLKIEIVTGTSLTEVSVNLPDPKAAAYVNAFLIERIQTYMTEYRIEKAQQNLEFVLAQHENAKERYEEAQMELARFQDENINLSTNIAQTRQQHLQDQRNLRFNVYQSISQEVEQARMALQQEIPVFNILEKPSIPSSPDTGSSDLVLVFSVVIGFFLSIGVVIIRNAITDSTRKIT